jgi:hypothetical protein
MINKKKILITLGLAAGAFLIFNAFKNADKKKKTSAGTPLISQIDAPTDSKQVYSKIGTKLFDKNKNPIMTFSDAGFGMTVTGYNNGVLSVVYGDTFYNGLPAYVNITDVQNPENVTESDFTNIYDYL